MFEKRNDFRQHDFYGPKYSKPVKKKKFGEFGIYCNNLMKHSLITGFSVIAASTSTARRTIKALVFLVCTAGFFYQTYSFLMMYLEYPTILDISLNHPETIEAPAVTMCNRNRVLRTRYCEAFNDSCAFKIKTYQQLCESYSRYCPTMEPKPYSYGIVDSRLLKTLNRSNEALEELGPQHPRDLIAGFTIKGKKPNSTTVAVQSAWEGRPHKCFTVMSLIGKPDEKPRNISLNDEYSFYVYLHPEEYTSPKDLIQAYVYVHDPHTEANAIAEGITLDAGNAYRMYVRMQKRESLPPPYKSNCTDFLKLWRDNGGYGPLTKRACTDVCKINAMVKEHGCVGQSITYPNKFPICSDSSIVTSEEVNENCSKSCNDGCEYREYSIVTELTDRKTEQLCTDKTNEFCMNEFMMLIIDFNRMTIQKFKHEPKFQSVELFSYIGGYMGMWLGISLVSLFDFVEMIYDILAYPVRKWRRDKRKKRRVQNLLRNPGHYSYDI